MFGKSEKRIKSKQWLELLRGENVEKANTRVDEKSSINYEYLERQTDPKTGEEKLVRIKSLKR